MQKKILISLFLIIMIIFMFTVNSYASTDYSVLQSDGTYRLSFSFKEKTNFDYPDINIKKTFDSPEIYFILTDYPYGNVLSAAFYVSSIPFRISDNGISLNFYATGGSLYTYYILKDGVWKNCGENKGSISFGGSDSNSQRIIMSSDDIKLGDEIYVYAYSKSLMVTKLRTINNYNVMSEVTSILSVILTVVIGIIGIRKGINFIKIKARNA